MLTKFVLLLLIAVPCLGSDLSIQIDVHLSSTPEEQIRYSTQLMREIAAARTLGEKHAALGKVVAHLNAVERYWPEATDAVARARLLQVDLALDYGMPTNAREILGRMESNPIRPEVAFRLAKVHLMLGELQSGTQVMDDLMTSNGLATLSEVDQERALLVGFDVARAAGDTESALQFLHRASEIDQLPVSQRATHLLIGIQHAHAVGRIEMAKQGVAIARRFIARATMKAVPAEELASFQATERQIEQLAKRLGL
jgi:hypothetical protein